jgi:hypothetical protein
MTLSITLLFYCAECHYAERRVLFIIIMLNVILPSVFMLSVVAPRHVVTQQILLIF